MTQGPENEIPFKGDLIKIFNKLTPKSFFDLISTDKGREEINEGFSGGKMSNNLLNILSEFKQNVFDFLEDNPTIASFFNMSANPKDTESQENNHEP